MDNIDKKILKQLQSNSKQNIKEIASKVGLSVTPTYERVKKLEQAEIIKSYVALLDRDKIGKKFVAFCQITLLRHHKELIDDFKTHTIKFPEIMECHHISGNFDFLLKIVVNDITQYQKFINEKLSLLDCISTINSSFVMESVKDTTVFEL
ncbi:Lrp/AsnC family transcriptional regulator [Aestuariibaculum suncheonense]|uniref:Lrp/AsnC family transcriptional regulator n=1 Tax=Aestuariibaculum suncheonense TaxID=1028745 RepID=A0A8J6QSD4_9FLAO|nr:Lrp/AsnC family transcriptional regulator [Aestuariibaculum suncheonense]MBD0835059.1 Lrp/AsnC family transcriptional regulator [Aestuariibaculum suncheonense]